MLRPAIVCAAILLPTAAGASDAPKAVCETLGPKINQAAEASSEYSRGVTSADLTKIQGVAKGKMREAITKAEDARAQLIPAMRAYIAALEDVGYQMKVCARQ